MRNTQDKRQIEYVQVSTLTPYARNSRTHTAQQVKQIAASIREFGFTNPVLIDEANGIIAGHGRVMAAEHLQLDVVPCIRLDYMTEAQKRAYVIADNKLALNAGWNDELLKVELDDLHSRDYDLSLLGFDAGELESIMQIKLDDDSDDDEVPEAPSIAVTKLGDIYQLGAHRIMCGDSTNANHVSALMSGATAQFVFTDPPYDMNGNEYAAVLDDHIADAHVFTMHDDRGIVSHLRKTSLEFRRFFVCDFGFSSPRGNDPYLRHILVSHEQHGKAIKHTNMQDGFSSIIKFDYRGRLKDEKLHDHQKPVWLVSKFMEHYSAEGAICYDAFLGSGTTLIAAEQLNRICYGMEISPAYCDVIVQRWEALTGKKAELING